MMWDMVVIGAGLAGSSLASTLSAAGWRVLLVEQGVLPRHKVCGEFLSPESQATLRALGLHDAVADLRPHPIATAAVWSRGGRHVRVALPGTALGVSRYALDAALANAARDAGADVRTGISATNIQRTQHGIAVTLRSRGAESSVEARAVVLACGRHPSRALRPASARAPRRTWVGIKGHYTGVAMPSDVEIYLFDGGYVGVAPVEGGRVNVCALVERSAFAARDRGAQQMLRGIADAHPALRRRLLDATLVPQSVTAVAPVDTGRPSIPWDRVARIGDAANMIPPLCGDGQAMALRSAELCAPLADAFLRGDCSLAEWEQRYRAAWHAEFDRRLRLGRALQSLLGTPGIDDALLGIGALIPGLTARVVRATRGAVAEL